MKKGFKKALSAVLTTSMLFSSVAFTPVTAMAAGFTTSGGWNECLYAEWQDSNPDSSAVQVGYKLSTETSYTYLSGDDLTYLVRPSSTSGIGRVDIPGLKAGRYDITVTASDGTVYTRNGIKVYANDRSGYAHFNWTEGVGAYNDDGTPKDNAIIVYVTDENKNSVTIPGYGNQTINYTKTTGETWTRDTAGIGDILNNNYNFIKQVTVTDDHPLIIRFVGTVKAPENLTPHGAKDTALGGSTSDNGFLAITKDARNITLEGIGPDATIDGWGFTFSKSSTATLDTDKNFEVSNLTFKNYPEDGLAFQGHEDNPNIQRCWVHNNTFYPGYCSNPTESDKKEGDGSCDFKRGMYYTMAYNHFIGCHKTNLLGSGGADNQYYMTLHHNWYQNVGSRQPLAASGNMHIYSTYFQGATSTTVDTRYNNVAFLEENYYEDCKNYYGSRNNTCVAKSYNEVFNGGSLDSVSGKRTIATSREQAAISDNGFSFPNGDAMTNFDTNTTHFYYDSANKKSDVSVLTAAADVPAYVTAHAGTLQPYEETESGEIIITVKSGSTPITGAKLTAAGLSFTELGNGVYSATASIGATYTVVVSKEGYSNVTINTTALAADGDTFTATADMVADTDGYAVVKLEGGTAGVPVKGATVKLNDGTVLVDQNDGTYKSASQLALGTYTATITNTGDYVAPTSAVSVVVKTTDEATIVELAKYTGTVNVTLTPAAGETETLDASKATVTVGDTALTYSNGVFTGAVEVGNAYAVTVKMPGWNTDSVSPATLTANRTSAVSATATLSYKGATVMWNYTDGTNTLNATVTANDWSSASSNPQSFEGLTLTKAVKMESSTSIKFTAETDGTLSLVMYSTNSAPYVNIDGVKYTVNQTGATEIPVTAGTHEIKKGTSSTYLYLVQLAAGGSSPDTTSSTTESTTQSTTESTTESTTQSTTESTTESTTQSTTESTTESTTQAPVQGVAVAVGSAEGTVGTIVTIPVKVSGMDTLAAADLTIDYDASKLTVTGVTAGNALTTDSTFDYNVAGGKIDIAAVNPRNTMGGDVICNITATLAAEGTSTVSATVNALYAENLAVVENASVTNGSVKANAAQPERVMGDANGDGTVTGDDVTHILNYVVGKITSVVDAIAADVTGDGKVTTRDANKIKKFVLGKISSL